MLTRPRSQARTLAAVVVIAVLCQLVANATHHHHGLAAAVSWVAFVGFWIALAAALVLVVLLAVALVRGPREIRS